MDANGEVCKNFNVTKYDAILARGLSKGLGHRGEQVCIEAAICEVLDLPHSDDPKCVAASVRSFKIALNDKQWSNTAARAKGLRDLGLAQLGSLGVVDDAEFINKLAKRTVQVILPTLFREIFPDNPKALEIAERCELEGTQEVADEAKVFANTYSTHYVSDACAYATHGFSLHWSSTAMADAASSAFMASPRHHALSWDKYFILAANLALEVLRELNSPGVKLLNE